MTYLRPHKLIEEVVKSLSTRLTGVIKWTNGNAITQINYMWGHPYEIVQSLEDMTQAATVDSTKYPLIALLTDYQETSSPGMLCEATFHILIASLTDPSYNAAQRDIENFDPILQPIHDEFLKDINKSGYFVPFYDYPGEKMNHYFWGKNGLFGQNEVKFSDFIDCIELTNFKLKVKKINQNCIT